MIKKKYKKISKAQNKLLKEWFANNLNNPYATKIIKKELSNKTSLTTKQVTSWLQNHRKKNKKKTQSKKKGISEDQRDMLIEYFQKKNKNPRSIELNELSELLNLDNHKISRWFAFERFKLKKLN